MNSEADWTEDEFAILVSSVPLIDEDLAPRLEIEQSVLSERECTCTTRRAIPAESCRALMLDYLQKRRGTLTCAMQ
jgi:hypothetical protein